MEGRLGAACEEQGSLVVLGVVPMCSAGELDAGLLGLLAECALHERSAQAGLPVALVRAMSCEDALALAREVEDGRR